MKLLKQDSESTSLNEHHTERGSPWVYGLSLLGVLLFAGCDVDVDNDPDGVPDVHVDDDPDVLIDDDPDVIHHDDGPDVDIDGPDIINPPDVDVDVNEADPPDVNINTPDVDVDSDTTILPDNSQSQPAPGETPEAGSQTDN